MTGDNFTEESFLAELKKIASQKEYDCFHQKMYTLLQKTDSTNSELLRKISASTSLLNSDGTRTCEGEKLHLSLVAAAQQSAGRGRVGRSYYSPPESGIYFSICYVPRAGVTDASVYTVAAAVGVCRAIDALCKTECRIKWVNDIYLNEKKVCGILTEGTLNPVSQKVEAAVIGIGINIVADAAMPRELLSKAGGICSAEGGGKLPLRTALLARVYLETVRILESSENIIGEYRARSFLSGKTVTVTPLVGTDSGSYSAKVLDITDDAGLLVQLKDKSTRTLHSGEVTLKCS